LKNFITNILGPFFLILRKIRKNKKNTNQSIIIISLHKLGDSVFTLYAIKEIISLYKENITIVCFPETKSIFELVLEGVRYEIISRRGFYFRELIAKKKSRKQISNLNPTIIFDLTGNINSASLIFNLRADKIVGINKEIYKNIYTSFTSIRKNPHIVDIYLDGIKSEVPISFNVDKISPKIDFTGNYILIHPFAGWRAKQWNLRKFIMLAKKLSQIFNCVLLFPENQLPHDIYLELKRDSLEFKTSQTIQDLIREISNCAIFIGNDSGPTHIANLLGKSTFTIYGPTNPIYHQPKNGINHYIQKTLQCSPKEFEKVCFTDGGRDGCPSFECMNLLEFDEVFTEVIKFIKRNQLEIRISKNSEA
jgi:ADP-heptose:LPS heptosyltransferase